MQLSLIAQMMSGAGAALQLPTCMQNTLRCSAGHMPPMHPGVCRLLSSTACGALLKYDTFLLSGLHTQLQSASMRR